MVIENSAAVVVLNQPARGVVGVINCLVGTIHKVGVEHVGCLHAAVAHARQAIAAAVVGIAGFVGF